MGGFLIKKKMKKLFQLKNAVSTFNLSFNPWIFAYLVMVIVTLVFFDRFGLPAAGTYLLLSFSTLFLLFFGFFLFKEENYVNDLLPFNRSFDRGTLVFVLGFFIPIIVFILGATLFKLNILSFNFYNPLIMAPLASGSTIEPTSFQALRLTATPTTQWFSETIGAPILEEILLGFGFIVISALLTVLFIMIFLSITTKGIAQQLLMKSTKYKKTIFTGAIIGSVLIFMGVHVFNDTYIENPKLFLFASIFRLVVNLLIFGFIKLGLEFGIGIHMSNNLLAFSLNPESGVGIDGLLTAMTTSVGLLLVMFIYIIPLLIIIIRWEQMKYILKKILKSLLFIERGSFDA